MLPHRAQRASSIVELLVVIGIISVLIALIVPTFAKARQQSRAISCRAQLQNIGMGLRMYLNDNDGRYPPAPYTPAFNPRRLPLVSQYLRKYEPLDATDPKAFACPADGVWARQYELSYSYNQELGERPIERSLFYRATRDRSRVPVLWDAENFHGGDLPFNWLFADGHVDELLDEPENAR